MRYEGIVAGAKQVVEDGITFDEYCDRDVED